MKTDLFDTFQIVALIVFLSVFLGRTLVLRITRNISPIVLGSGKRGFNRAIELAFFVGLVVWITEVALYALRSDFRVFPPPLDTTLVDSIPAKLVGVLLLSAGLAIFIWALASFGDSWRVGIDQRKPGELVTKGAFAFSRNPIFIFLDLYFAGTFLINGTIIFLLFAVIVVAGAHYQIRNEERFLTSHYGQTYLEYCARTGRYLTGPWRRAGGKRL
jgi:protein-S-isoprenylcysteine O-methyltransferase Ste14